MTTFEPGARTTSPTACGESRLDRLLREQAGADHHRRVRRIGARRDRRDDDGAVVEVEGLARVRILESLKPTKRRETTKTNQPLRIILPGARPFVSDGDQLLEASPGCTKDVHQVWSKHFHTGLVMTGTHFPGLDGRSRGLLVSTAEGVTVAATAGVIYLLTTKYDADVAICRPEQAIASRFPVLLVDDGDPWAPLPLRAVCPGGRSRSGSSCFPASLPTRSPACPSRLQGGSA